jgi:hypothetical protein
MNMIFVNEKGDRWEGLVLAVGEGVIRFQARGCQDVFELHIANDRWTSETGQSFEVEALMDEDRANLATILGRRTANAGFTY